MGTLRGVVWHRRQGLRTPADRCMPVGSGEHTVPSRAKRSLIKQVESSGRSGSPRNGRIASPKERRCLLPGRGADTCRRQSRVRLSARSRDWPAPSAGPRSLAAAKPGAARPTGSEATMATWLRPGPSSAPAAGSAAPPSILTTAIPIQQPRNNHIGLRLAKFAIFGRLIARGEVLELADWAGSGGASRRAIAGRASPAVSKRRLNTERDRGWRLEDARPR